VTRGRTAAFSTLTGILVAAWIGFFISAAAAQGRSNSATGRSLFSATQAQRGQAIYTDSCSVCHSDDLSGDVPRGTPAVAGESFMAFWEANLNGLFTKIKTRMPRNNPGILTDEAYLDVMAYVLQANGFPAGLEGLKAESLNNVQIVRKSGSVQKTVPNFVLVDVVGCLAQADNLWKLTNTSQPMATQEQPATLAASKEAEMTPLGTETFRLVSVTPFRPDSHRGHKVQVKGLLYRGPSNNNRLDVTSLQMLAVSCLN
jgi:S-disulfanyl-L-cysteine oxidoreductase SoxD